MNERYMKLAIREAEKSLSKEDIPVGAILVKGNKIIAKAYNKYNCYKTIHDHAEIRCINKAIKKIGNSYLDECILYITMEPCLMCFGAIMQTNIKKIVYAIKNEKTGFSKFINFMPKIEIEQNVLATEAKKMLNNFFKTKRI